MTSAYLDSPSSVNKKNMDVYIFTFFLIKAKLQGQDVKTYFTNIFLVRHISVHVDF